MIVRFVKAWEQGKEAARATFAAKHPEDYGAIVRLVVETLAAHLPYGRGGEPDRPDPERITSIDHGDYQGTLVYVVGEAGYKPSNYWVVLVGYGSCSGCDTLEDIRSYSDDPPTEAQVEQYLTLALDIVRGFKHVGRYAREVYADDPEAT